MIAARVTVLIGIVLIGTAVLADQVVDISSDLELVRKQNDIPALVGATITSQRLEAIGATGVRKIGAPDKVTVNDQFHLGSDTKAMTATLLAIFVEQGRLSWKDPLEKLLPDLTPPMNPAYRAVTLEQLLAHRAGLSEDTAPHGVTLLQLRQWPGSLRDQRRRYTEMVLSDAPINRPGSAFLYSNRSYIVAGEIAERVGNDSWENLITARLFKPLHMESCGFGAPGTPGKIDEPWQHGLIGSLRTPLTPGPLADNPPLIGPAGTVHCSIGDWAKFAQAHLRGEKGDTGGILTPETFRYLHKPVMDGKYAFGWLVEDRAWGGGRVLTHAGSNSMSFAVIWIAPIKDFAVLAATNQGGAAAAKACDDASTKLIHMHLEAKS